MVFLDANCVIELLIPERIHHNNIKNWLRKNSNETLSISTLSTHIIWYIGQKEKVSDVIIGEVIDSFEIVDFNTKNYYEGVSFYSSLHDIEDCFQLSCALESGCSIFLTLDNKLAQEIKKIGLPISPILISECLS